MSSLLFEVTEVAIKLLIETWVKWYRKRPVLAVFLTINLLGLLTVSIVLTERNRQQNSQELVNPRLAALDTDSQLKELDSIQSGLENLLIFVDEQRKKVLVEQEIVNNLKKEKELLEPIVESDRQIVEALLQIQEQNALRNRWKDITIGFISGFISEIIVGILLAPYLVPRLKAFVSRYRKPQSVNNSATDL